MSEMELVDVDLGYSNKEKDILSNISLQIKSEKAAIVGPNGSGKTTIIKAVFGLAKITHGIIKIMGADAKFTVRTSGVACNLDTVYRLVDLPIKNVIKMYCSIMEIEQKNVLAHIEKYDLSEILPKKTRELSTGQNKAFFDIMAIELGNKLSLLDEPFENLDARRRLMMIEDLKNFKGSLLINTHDFTALKSLPGWGLYLIADGQIYGRFSSSDINRLYLTRGEVPAALSVIRSKYGIFSVTLDKGDASLLSSTDLESSIQEVIR